MRSTFHSHIDCGELFKMRAKVRKPRLSSVWKRISRVPYATHPAVPMIAELIIASDGFSAEHELDLTVMFIDD